MKTIGMAAAMGLGGALTIVATAAHAEYIINTGDTFNPNGLSIAFEARRPYAVAFTLDKSYALTSAGAFGYANARTGANFRFGIASDLGGIPGSGSPGAELFGCSVAATTVRGLYECSLSGVLGAGSYFLTAQTDAPAGIETGAGNFSSPVYRLDAAGTEYSKVSFSAQFLLQGDAGGVPEPSTWAITIVGFGLVGGALRRRTASRFVIG